MDTMLPNVTERPASDTAAQNAVARQVGPLEFLLRVLAVAVGLVLGVIVAVFIGLTLGWVNIC